jgi:hypothetical protein
MRLAHVCIVISLALTPSVAASQSLRGRVVDAASRQPLLGVYLKLLRDEKVVATATTDSTGRFVVSAPTGGRYRLAGSRLGYADATSAPVELSAGEAINAELLMSSEPVKVAPLVVERPPDPYLASTGFYDRMKSNSGDFMTGDQVKHRNSLSVVELLRGLRGVRVQRVNSNNEVTFIGANCYPIVAVDGVTMRWGGKTLGPGQPLDDLVRVDHIDAIEAYRGGAGAPTAFVGPNASCGVILIWTRHK